MSIIKWTEELSVGVTAFDNDHKKLLEIFNKLFTALSQGAANEVVPTILTELSNYTKTHFNNEENAFKKFNYPEYESHKKLHDGFIKELQDLNDKFNKGHFTLAVPMFNILTDWIKNHIKTIDKKYTNFLNQNGLK
jgi:hemerythrin-like metal-binding protein